MNGRAKPSAASAQGQRGDKPRPKRNGDPLFAETRQGL